MKNRVNSESHKACFNGRVVSEEKTRSGLMKGKDGVKEREGEISHRLNYCVTTRAPSRLASLLRAVSSSLYSSMI